MKNKYPGICYRCGQYVNVGEGHFERNIGKGWRVQHANCAIKYRRTDKKVICCTKCDAHQAGGNLHE
jgi:hypothetical protein